jgi:hypothetical protein
MNILTGIGDIPAEIRTEHLQTESLERFW